MNSLERSPVAMAVLLSIQAICAHADTDALVFPASTNHVIGYINKGVGWSFVPKTNLVMTWVGFEDNFKFRAWPSYARVTIWISTNTPLAVYTSANVTLPVEIDTNSVVYGMVYARICPLPLMATMEYHITLDLGSNTQVLELFASDLSQSDGSPFQAASELIYLGRDEYDVRNGFLETIASPAVLLGPTFRFRVAAEIVPRLGIESIDDGVALTWPTNSPDCVIETSTSPAGPGWEQAANAPTVIRDRYVSPYYFPDNEQRFFRLKLR